jgi:hypothetical protein
MKLSFVLGAAVAAMLAGRAAPAHAADSVDTELLAMQHEASLQAGEKLLIAYHRDR